MCKVLVKGNLFDYKGRFVADSRMDSSVSGVTRGDRVFVSQGVNSRTFAYNQSF